MNIKNLKTYSSYLYLILLIALGLHGLVNLVFTIKEMQKNTAYRKIVPYKFVGSKFSGLEETFKDVPFVGYFTDRDIEAAENNMQYSQAQFILAPTVLDNENYGRHDYILFDCTAMNVCIEKMKELNAIPLKHNTYGIVLTQKSR